jgi:phosphoglycerate dehydrogenase-like enzyme
MWDRGIQVTSAANVNAIPVAEFAFSQIVFCLKHGWKRVREVERERRFLRDDDGTPGSHGSTIGLLSLSRTGRLVAERLRSLEVEVIAYDPLASVVDAASLGVRLCSLEEVFRQSDVLSCHAPLLPSTVRLIRGFHFAMMKAGATFINTARGQIVHESEMIEVLQRRPDLFAVLDVTESEPPVPNSPLFTLRNVVMTPHLAGSVGRECRRMGRMMVDETRRYLCGESLQGEVRPDQLAFLA